MSCAGKLLRHLTGISLPSLDPRTNADHHLQLSLRGLPSSPSGTRRPRARASVICHPVACPPFAPCPCSCGATRARHGLHKHRHRVLGMGHAVLGLRFSLFPLFLLTLSPSHTLSVSLSFPAHALAHALAPITLAPFLRPFAPSLLPCPTPCLTRLHTPGDRRVHCWTRIERRRREERGARGAGARNKAARGATGAIHAPTRGCAARRRGSGPVYQRRASIAERPGACSPSFPARSLPSTRDTTCLVASALFRRASAIRTRRARQRVEVSHWGHRTFPWRD